MEEEGEIKNWRKEEWEWWELEEDQEYEKDEDDDEEEEEEDDHFPNVPIHFTFWSLIRFCPRHTRYIP